MALEIVVTHPFEIERVWHEAWIEALRTMRTSFDETTARPLVRAATFLVGSITIEDPVQDTALLESTFTAATKTMLLGCYERIG